MAFEDLSLKDYLQILFRRKRVIFSVFLLSVLMTTLMAGRQQDLYSAIARVKVQRQQTFADFVASLKQAQSVDAIDNYLEEIKSFNFLKRVVTRTYPGDPQVDANVMYLQDHVQVSRLPKTDLIDIEVQTEDKSESMQIANDVATTFIQYHQENITRNARQVKEQIEEWRNQIMTQLYSDERALKEFREQFGVVDIATEGGNLVTRISELEAQLLTVDSELSSLDGSIKSWNQRIGNVLNSDDTTEIDMSALEGLVGDSQYLTGVKDRIFNLQMGRVELLGSGNYTTNHPQVKHLEVMLNAATGKANDERRQLVKVQVEELLNRRAGLQSGREQLVKQIALLKERQAQLPDLEREARKHVRRKDISEKLYTFLSQKLEEAKISELERAEIAYVVSPAMSAREISADKLRIVVAGLLLGLILGVAMAFVAENLDTSISTIEVIEQSFNIPVLGVIPHIVKEGEIEAQPGRRAAIRSWAQGRWYVRPIINSFKHFFDYVLGAHTGVVSQQGIELIAQFDPKSPGAEAYRTVRTNIEYYCRTTGSKVILFSSAGPAEGKSVTLTNVAVAMAQLGRRVLVVSANMRRPSIGRIFGIDEAPGLSDILLENETWEGVSRDMADLAVGKLPAEQVLAMPGLDNLTIITSGGVAAQPSEWLASERMAHFLKEVRDQFDYVLVDSPPVLPVPDGMILGRMVDGVVMVYQLGQTTRESMRRALVNFRQTEANVAGIILNDLQSEWAAGGEFFQYRFYYGKDEHVQMPWDRADGAKR